MRPDTQQRLRYWEWIRRGVTQEQVAKAQEVIGRYTPDGVRRLKANLPEWADATDVRDYVAAEIALAFETEVDRAITTTSTYVRVANGGRIRFADHRGSGRLARSPHDVFDVARDLDRAVRAALSDTLSYACVLSWQQIEARLPIRDEEAAARASALIAQAQGASTQPTGG
jgi:hypothetical protein